MLASVVDHRRRVRRLMATVYIRVRPRLADGRLTNGTKDSEPYAHLLGRRVGHVFEAIDVDAKTLRLLRTIGVLEVSCARPNHMVRGGSARRRSVVTGDGVELPIRKVVTS